MEKVCESERHSAKTLWDMRRLLPLVIVIVAGCSPNGCKTPSAPIPYTPPNEHKDAVSRHENGEPVSIPEPSYVFECNCDLPKGLTKRMRELYDALIVGDAGTVYDISDEMREVWIGFGGGGRKEFIRSGLTPEDSPEKVVVLECRRSSRREVILRTNILRTKTDPSGERVNKETLAEEKWARRRGKWYLAESKIISENVSGQGEKESQQD